MESASHLPQAHPHQSAHDSANNLSENELLRIFGNSCISTNDLFRFRFVNRSWRDAATSVLLKRNACHLLLTTTWAPSVEAVEAVVQVFCNARDNYTFLDDLVTLMSSSSKFPTTHLRLLDYPETETAEKELIQFLELYGKQIKFLSVNRLSSNQLNTLLYNNHLPALQYLELPNCLIFPDPVEGQHPELSQGQRQDGVVCDALKTLRLGRWFDSADGSHRNFLKQLLRSAVNLTSIENATITDLGVILEENKGPLVKELKLDLGLFVDCSIGSDGDDNDLRALDRFGAVNSTVRKLTVIYSYLLETSHIFPKLVAAINSVIEANKDTIEYLEMFVNPTNFRTRLNIPPMQNLTCIRFNESYFKGDSESRFRNENEELGYIFKFDEQVPTAQYFPRLKKVVLNLRNYDTDRTLMDFYNFGTTFEDATNGDCVPIVDEMEIASYVWPTVIEAKSISLLFPNIRNLRIKCDDSRGLSNSLWVLCPLVESIEIYGMSTGVSADEIEIADKFFTGFPLEICLKLRSTKLPSVLSGSAEAMDFLRVAPSVCRLRRLRELKIKFVHLWGQFASEVSGEHGFLRMPETKIIFSYNPASVRADQIRYVDSYLASMEKYVQVVREK